MVLFQTSILVCISRKTLGTINKMHTKCRAPNLYFYQESGETKSLSRSKVPENAISWDFEFDGYDPVDFTAPHVLTAPWADPKLDDHKPCWNNIDGKVDRRSHEGQYLVRNSVCLNIRGRTGLKGRGTLGKWGPNHAADPIVTRWKRSKNGSILKDSITGKNILQFVGIKRRDTGEWAIPGGMVDPGETVSVTLKREFMEEAMNSLEVTEDARQEMIELTAAFFSSGFEVYKGYVDDPRNTDNAWMETVAQCFHDEKGETVGKFNLKAGDDATDLQWIDINKSTPLYASHSEFLQQVANLKNANW